MSKKKYDHPWLKRLGYINNIAKGGESIGNQLAHLIVGVLGSLPSNAVSLRVSVAFYLSAALEIPTGIVADLIGHRRTLALGYALAALASISLFFACHFSDTPYALPLVILNGTLAALAGGMMSGCFQAYLQDMIERGIERSGCAADDATELKLKAIALSQRYGVFFSGLLPVLVMAGAFTCYHVGVGAEWTLLMPAVIFAALSCYFFLYARDDQPHSRSVKRSAWAHCVDYGIQLKSFYAVLLARSASDRFALGLLVIRVVLSILTVIHVHTYLMVSELRSLDLQSGQFTALLLGFGVLAAFDLAHYPKGLIAPIVGRHLSAQQVLYFSLSSQIVLAVAAMSLLHGGYATVAVISFVLLFTGVFSPGNTTLQSTFLADIPEDLRATVFSLVQMLVLIVYGSYSAILTWSGVGIGGPQQIFIELLGLSVVGLLLTLLSAYLQSPKRPILAPASVKDRPGTQSADSTSI